MPRVTVEEARAVLTRAPVVDAHCDTLLKVEPAAGRRLGTRRTDTQVDLPRLVEAGVATPDDVDKASRLGFNLPLGQLEIADNLGLDTVLDLALRFHDETGDPKFLPPPLLRRMVAAGLLGRRSGRGFYDYAQ